MSLLPADNAFAVWAVLLAGAAFAAWAEHTRWGRRLSGVLVAILLAMVLSNLRLIPRESPTYDTVLAYLVPVAIPLLLFDAHLGRILRETGAMLAAFAIGTAGVVAGVWVGLQFIPLGPDGPALAGIFAATYIGGSLNFMAVAQATGYGESGRLAASVAADALVTAIHIAVLMALPSLMLLRRWIPSPIIAQADRAAADAGGVAHGAGEVRFDLFGVSAALALAFGISALGFALARWVGLDGFGILFISGLALVPGNVFPGLPRLLPGHREVGMVVIYVFLFVIGASADLWAMLGSALPITLFAGVIVTVHLLLTLGAGALFRLDLAELIIASNACVGGSSSAGPIAAARGWHGLVTPGILCGALGNAIGTFIGVGVTRWLG